MRTRAIVTEYNPFHRGHREQIETLRAHYGRDLMIMAVMSGDWVQRGGPAILNKWTRTELALEQGVDLVLELPVIFATGGAELFAEGAVRLIEATGICRHQSAGAESPDEARTTRVASLLADEPPDYQTALREGLERGLSFARAREDALVEVLGDEALRPWLRQSNHILNIAYRTAQLRHAPAMQLDLHPRGPGNASAIRERLASLPPDAGLTDVLRAVAASVPPEVAAAIADAHERGELMTDDAMLTPVAALLRTRTPEVLHPYAGMGEGVAERLCEIAASADVPYRLEAWVGRAASPRHPRARIRRACATALLGIRQADQTHHVAVGPRYLRVLGFTKQGRYALKLMRRYARLPILTKASDYRETAVTKDPDAIRQATWDLRGSDLRAYLAGDGGGLDFARSVVMR